MFSKSSVPEPKPFNLSFDKISEDIAALYQNEEERNKLYYCLDEKPPTETKFNKIEDFLRGSNDLEAVSDNLADLVDELERMTKQVLDKVKKIRSEAEETCKYDLL